MNKRNAANWEQVSHVLGGLARRELRLVDDERNHEVMGVVLSLFKEVMDHGNPEQRESAKALVEGRGDGKLACQYVAQKAGEQFKQESIDRRKLLGV